MVKISLHPGACFISIVISILTQGLALDLRHPRVKTSQSSTAGRFSHAGSAVDQRLNTISHTERRLRGNVIRAGMSSNHLLNPEIGRVRNDQAVSGAVVDFTPEPYVTARYVSVDVPRSGPGTIVQLTEVMVEEFNMHTTMGASSTAVILTGNSSSQSSTLEQDGNRWDAARAVDGYPMYGDTSCSRTNIQQNPWWKSDLTSVRCVGAVAIRNIDALRHNTRLNLMGAVARAGLSDTPTDNAMCGSSVTQYQAFINDWIEFTCDPSRLARYVSINIPGEAALILCEVRVLPCDLQPPALNLTEKPRDQSSAVSGQDAGKAFDGLPEEPFCSLTGNEENPWWRVDLESSYCLGIIQVRNTGSPTEPNLQDSVVRAGLSEVHTNNIMCGTPLTSEQSTINDWIKFTCDPPVLARYVSVDIPGPASLKLCEVTVSPCDLQQKAKVMDFTVVANRARLGDAGDNDSSITAYKGAEDVSVGVSFGRQLPTGGRSNDLPSGSVVLADPSTGCADKLVLRLPEEGGLNRTGVFFSEMISDDITTRVQVVILPDGNDTDVRPTQRTQTANIGDSVMLQMHDVNSPSTDYRWRHNGGVIIESWNNFLNVTIPNVTVEKEGIYACFALDQENEQLHGIMRLIVRGCPFGLWAPPSCLKICRRCYNGGVCDDKSGTCVCPPGFSGDSCEQAQGRHVFGKTADQRCSNSTDAHNDACRGRLFCLPDPYGCSCAAGYKGLDCMQDCDDGTFGAGCQQTCHCASGGTCSKDTGECSTGCAASYFGSNCQCSTENAVLGLEATSGDPRQLFVTWQPDLCASRYELTIRDECADVVSQELTSENAYHFVTGLEYPLSHRVYMRPVYPGDELGPEVTFPQTTEPTMAPVDVNFTLAAPYSLSFSWSKPPCGSRGGITTGYTYKLTEGSPESQVIIQTVTSEESVTIEGLTPLTEYSFQVAANTIAGTGPYSQAAVGTTLQEVQSTAEITSVPVSTGEGSTLHPSTRVSTTADALTTLKPSTSEPTQVPTTTSITLEPSTTEASQAPTTSVVSTTFEPSTTEATQVPTAPVASTTFQPETTEATQVPTTPEASTTFQPATTGATQVPTTQVAPTTFESSITEAFTTFEPSTTEVTHVLTTPEASTTFEPSTTEATQVPTTPVAPTTFEPSTTEATQVPTTPVAPTTFEPATTEATQVPTAPVASTTFEPVTTEATQVSTMPVASTALELSTTEVTRVRTTQEAATTFPPSTMEVDEPLLVTSVPESITNETTRPPSKTNEQPDIGPPSSAVAGGVAAAVVILITLMVVAAVVHNRARLVNQPSADVNVGVSMEEISTDFVPDGVYQVQEPIGDGMGQDSFSWSTSKNSITTTESWPTPEESKAETSESASVDDDSSAKVCRAQRIAQEEPVPHPPVDEGADQRTLRDLFSQTYIGLF
ncbi:uncharacterized protein LOC110983161 isoform X2 [Acanthaster planci]|uniref:Uncharacterized protein LOC110983161 isoform X2 n=1 Tax=Acanthaster planci TaxID=133434 RepID=A0A8B7Z3B6_ACAPL|nr:uncharacterized protein LOC110983161 isoform X2 [Acanthaster planci]